MASANMKTFGLGAPNCCVTMSYPYPHLYLCFLGGLRNNKCVFFLFKFLLFFGSLLIWLEMVAYREGGLRRNCWVMISCLFMHSLCCYFVLYLVSLVSSLQRNGKIICSHFGWCHKILERSLREVSALLLRLNLSSFILYCIGVLLLLLFPLFIY